MLMEIDDHGRGCSEIDPCGDCRTRQSGQVVDKSHFAQSMAPQGTRMCLTREARQLWGDPPTTCEKGRCLMNMWLVTWPAWPVAEISGMRREMIARAYLANKLSSP
jgi:hypothetical protein